MDCDDHIDNLLCPDVNILTYIYNNANGFG